MESLSPLFDRAMNIVERAIGTLEQASGLQFAVLFALAVGAVVVVRLLVKRLLPRGAAQPPSAPRQTQTPEPSDQTLATDHAMLESENPALTGYRQILETRGVAASEQDALIREYTEHLEDMQHRLADITDVPGATDQGLSAKLAQSHQALARGAVDQAVELLGDIAAMESETGQTLRQQSEQRLMGATLARLVAGDLEMAIQNTLDAAEHYRAAIESVPPGNEILLAECLNKHGTALYRGRNPEAAVISFKRAVKLVERAKGPNDPDLATALNNLAMLYFIQGEYTAAEPLYKRALDIDQSALGADATAVSTDLNNLALLYKKQDRVDEAEPLMKRALAIKTKHFDPGHPSLVTGLRNYAGILRALGRDEEAEAFEAQADTLPPQRRPEDADT